MNGIEYRSGRIEQRIIQRAVTQPRQDRFEPRRLGDRRSTHVQIVHQPPKTVKPGNCFEAETGQQNLESHAITDLGEGRAVKVKPQGVVWAVPGL